MSAVAEPTTDLAGHDLSSLASSCDAGQAVNPLASAKTVFVRVRSAVERSAAREPSAFLMSNAHWTLVWPGAFFLILVVFGTLTVVVTVSPAAAARAAIAASIPQVIKAIHVFRVLSITATSPRLGT